MSDDLSTYVLTPPPTLTHWEVTLKKKGPNARFIVLGTGGTACKGRGDYGKVRGGVNFINKAYFFWESCEFFPARAPALFISWWRVIYMFGSFCGGKTCRSLLELELACKFFFFFFSFLEKSEFEMRSLVWGPPPWCLLVIFSGQPHYITDSTISNGSDRANQF